MALPSGYTQLEYIESSGTQYIDTNVSLASSGVRIDCDFQFTKYVNNTFVIRPYNNGEIYAIGLYNNAFHTANVTMSQTSNMLARTTATGSTAKSANMTLKLFAQHVYGSAIENYAYVRLYSCQVYSNNTLVRDFIPCKNTSGTVGLWDDVNSVFYENKGSGTFTAGPVVDPMAPHDGHNTNIGNVAREIESGTVLLSGVLREIEKGLTLVNGVQREIDIQSKRKFTVSITSSGFHDMGLGYRAYAYVTINNKKYDDTTTLELEEGTIITCFVNGNEYGNSAISVDGVQVVRVSYTSATYDYTLTSNINIALSVFCSGSTAQYGNGTIKITTA